MSLIKLTGSIIEANTITSENIATGAVTQNNLAQGLSLSGIRISTITYPEDDTAANTAGGQSIVLTGAGFESGAAVLVDYVSVGSVTVTNSTSISFTAPAKSAGGYLVHVINPDGATAIHVPGIQYSGTPTWSTAAGSVGSFYEYTAVSNTVAATSDSTVQYSVVSGSLPTGATMNGNGVITGTAPAESGATTFTFTVRANDAENQSTDRTFTITVNPDVVDWSAPANNATITTYEYVPISNTFASTSRSGMSVSYAADTLPANVTISGATVSGTPTTVGNTTSIITATADTTGKTSTQTLNFAVQQDSVTWSSPANNTTYTLAQNVANTTSLSATSAAGFDVSYSANVLPTGMSISGNTITGTPTVAGNTTTLITATAATTNRTATRVLNWVVALATDTYWKNTTLLLSSNTSIQAASILKDYSINAVQINAIGDVSASDMNPYQRGYYSDQFNGANTYLTIPYNSSFDFPAGVPMCFEGWIHPQSYSTTFTIASRNWNYGGSGPTWGLIATSATAIEWSIAGTGAATYVLTRNQSLVAPYTIPLNKWTHVAFTRDASNVCRIFVNGYLVASQTYTGALSSASGDMYIGVPQSGSAQSTAWANGLMSNLRLTNGSIPSAYTTSSTTTGQQIFTPPTQPLSNIGNTALLICSTNKYEDISPAASIVTSYGNGKVTRAHPFTSTYQSNTTPYYSNYFSGSNYALGSLATGITIGTNDFCLEGWGYWTSFNNGTYGAPIISLYGDTAGELMIRANKTSANTTSANWFSILGGSSYIPSAMYTSGVSGGTLYLNRWHHLAVSRKSGVWSFFVDGARVSTTSAGDASLTLPFNKAYIGSDGPSGGGYMTGQVSNLRLVVGDYVYDGATYTVPTSPLTAIAGTKMLTAQDSTFKDNSGYTTYTFTQSNANTKPFVASPFIEPSLSNTQVTTFGSAYFDGTGDYISMPNQVGCQLGTGDFTIEFWWYLTSPFSSVDGPGIGQKAGDAYNGWVIYRNHASNTDKITIRIGSSNADYPTTAVPKMRVWQHWAVVRSGTTLTWYCDGVACGSYTGVTGNATDTTGGMYIGYSQTWGYVVGSGYMADVRITKAALYSTNFVPNFTGPLTAVANTQLLTLQNNANYNNNGFKDISPFDNALTRAGNPTSGTFSPYGDNWSTHFTGSSTALNTNTALSTAMGGGFAGNIISIEMWVFPTTFNLSYGGSFIGAYQAVSANGRWNFYHVNTSAAVTKLGFAYTTGTGSQNNIETTSDVLYRNQWNHIAITIDATTSSSANVVIFANGSRVQSWTGQNMSTHTTYYSYPAIGGPNSSYVSQFTGFISDVRIMKGNLAYSTSTYSVPTSPLPTTNNTVLSTCISNRFIDNSTNNITLVPTGAVTVHKFSPYSNVTVPKYYSSLFTRSATDYYTFSPGVFGGQGTAFTFECWVYLNSLDSSLFRTAGGLEVHINASGALMIQHSEVVSICTSSNGVLATRRWYHIAVTRTVGNLYTGYVDGVSVCSNTYTTSLGTLNTSIGWNTYSHSQYGMNGYISNLRTTTTVVYTGNFTPPTSPLTATQSSGTNISAITAGQTTLLTMNSQVPLDATGTRTIVMGNAPKVQPTSPFISTATDAVVYTSNTFGGSMYFDGTGDKLTIANYQGLGFKTNDFTIQCWFYTNAASTEQTIATNGWASYAPWLIRIDSSNVLRLNMSLNGGSWYVNEASLGTVVVGQWYHVAVTRGGGILRAFVNGVMTYTTDLTGSALYDGSQALNVGGRSDTSVPFNGYIADFQIINGASLYYTNFYPGSSPANTTVTVGANTHTSTILLTGTPSAVVDATRSTVIETVGNTVVATFDPYGGSYYSNYFDGSGDYITAPASSSWDFGTGDFTVECWINQSVITSTDQVIAFHGWSGSGALNYGWNLRTIATTGVLCFSVSTSGIDQRQFTDLVVKAGKWHHVAICCTGGVVSAYLDGVKSTTTYSGASYVARPTATLVLGGWNDNNEQIAERYWYTGYISNFRIVKGNALYSASFTPSTSPLTAVSNTQVLVCAANRFVDGSSSNVALTTAGNVAVKTQNPFRVNSGVSYYFDGTGDYLASPLGLPAFGIGTDDFTVEGWIYNTQAASYVFLDFRNAGTLDFVLNNSGTGMQMNSGGTALIDTGANAFKLNEWVHFMARRVNGVGTIHINGVQKANGAVTTDFGATGSLTIGTAGDARGNDSYDFGAGYLADVRITKGVGRSVAVPTEPLMVK